VIAPLSVKLRCMFSGHDWRTAIGPRDGFFERCRRCHSTRLADDAVEATAGVAESSQRAA
jgi:hypothetical protein